MREEFISAKKASESLSPAVNTESLSNNSCEVGNSPSTSSIDAALIILYK